MTKVTYVAIAALFIGTGTGWLLHGLTDANAPAALAQSESAPGAGSPTSVDAYGMIDTAQLRAMMREELAASRMSEPAGSGPAAIPVKEIPATPELLARRREAVEEIEMMLNAAQWGNEQRAGFQQRLSMLDPDQARHMLREVTIAINEGRLQVTTDGPPL